MLYVPYDAELADGTWRFIAGTGEVIIACPDCGRPMLLTDHRVDDFGRVFPAFTCGSDADPQAEAGCGFARDVLLEDWTYQKVRHER